MRGGGKEADDSEPTPFSLGRLRKSVVAMVTSRLRAIFGEDSLRGRGIWVAPPGPEVADDDATMHPAVHTQLGFLPASEPPGLQQVRPDVLQLSQLGPSEVCLRTPTLPPPSRV